MQTFLPYPNFEESARCLDRQRLGKQRLEVKQILKALLGYTDAWKHHPATKMWDGYEIALVEYGQVICTEWRRRDYFDSISYELIELKPDGALILPSWFGREDFHRSHRSNLLRKYSSYYRLYGWTDPDNLPYVWPV